MQTIHANTEQFYNSIVKTLEKLQPDVFKGLCQVQFNQMMGMLRSVVYGDKSEIKKAFKNKLTHFLLSESDMAKLQKAHDNNEDFVILVTHQKELILALLKDDIDWDAG